MKDKLLVHSDQEIVTRVTFSKNAVLVSKFISSCKLAQGYHPAVAGLEKTPLSEDVQTSPYEIPALLALHRFIGSKDVRGLDQSILRPKTLVYFYWKGAKRGQLYFRFLKETHDHYIFVSRTENLKGYSYTVAYEETSISSQSLTYLRNLKNWS